MTAGLVKIGLWLFFLGCPTVLLSQSSPWLIHHRLQMGLEHDSNVFESRRNPSAAAATRLAYHGQMKRPGNRWQFQAMGAGIVQVYPQATLDDKWTGDVQLRATWLPRPRWLVQVGYVGFLKMYFKSNLDFAHLTSDVRLQRAVSDRSYAALVWESTRLDYRYFDSFDFTARRVGVVLGGRVRDGWLTELALSRRAVQYLRPATRIGRVGEVEYQPFRQKDRQWIVRWQLSARQRLFWQASVEWLRNRSNSFGYSQDRLRGSLIIAWPLNTHLLARVALLFQYYRYHEPILPAFPIELDVERNESNFLVADLSYNLTDNTNLLLRLAWYNNESAIRGLFYQKILLFAGLERRF